jgi:hypothetical protein
MGLGRDGRYDYLYDESHFFSQRTLQEQFNELNQGSLALKLPELS